MEHKILKNLELNPFNLEDNYIFIIFSVLFASPILASNLTLNLKIVVITFITSFSFIIFNYKHDNKSVYIWIITIVSYLFRIKTYV